MNSARGCIPCFLRQALGSVRLVSPDAAFHEYVRREVLRWLGEMDLRRPPPAVGQILHRRLRSMLGTGDPYRGVKVQQNRMALALLAEFRAEIQGSADPLSTALRVALAGNMIDVKVKENVGESEVRGAVRQAMARPLDGDYLGFRQAAAGAQRILYLTDNAGEVVFDRLLIEQLAPAQVTAAVRGAPVINDATSADAQAVGLQEVAAVIDNGSDAPGTLLDDCSQAFQRHFAAADLVIAKGQGNFETLHDRPGNIAFLFKVKCAVVSRHSGLPVGTHVLAGSCADPRGGGTG